MAGEHYVIIWIYKIKDFSIFEFIIKNEFNKERLIEYWISVKRLKNQQRKYTTKT
jgi:hypothetical protein